jgi:hypothetical protein
MSILSRDRQEAVFSLFQHRLKGVSTLVRMWVIESMRQEASKEQLKSTPGS